MLTVNDRLRIPLTEFQFSFARSGGPGGQNVNKVNSKAQLRWNVQASPSISDEVRARFVAAYRRRMTAEGIVVVTSQRYRDQGRNVADCLAKLRELILAVATAPQSRKATRPTAGSVRRRRENKQARSQRKQSRRPPRDMDD